MKLTFLLLFSFVVISTCSAQIPSGTLFVGGSASFSSNSSKNNQNPDITYKTKSTSLNFNPKVGYFITDNIALGIGINFYNSKSRFEDYDLTEQIRNKNNSIGINPFGRYYKLLSEKVGFFGQFTLSYTKGRGESNGNIHQKNSSFGASLAPGFVFFATPKIGIETTIGNIGYFHYKNENYSPVQNNPTQDYNSSQFAANIEANNVFVGINFYFGL